ncbi:MAG: hypothetical protein IJS56_02220 [Bacilli bacterium]|nr:hypothetical protein [Bacilli bacterium]
MENLERKFNIGFLSVSLFVLLSLLGLYILLEITESKPNVNLASNYNINENII